MKLKRLAVSILSVGLIMSLGTGSTLVSANGAINETKSTKAEVEFTGGKLYLGRATENISFGSEVLDKEKINENGDYEFKAIGPEVEVNDLRGTGTGWTLSSQVSHFSKDEGDQALLGSKITFGKPLVERDEKYKEIPSPYVVEEETVMITGADSQPVVTAFERDTYEDSEGRGTWLIDWSSGGVKLNVPAATAQAGKYTSTITWTLTNDSTTRQ